MIIPTEFDLFAQTVPVVMDSQLASRRSEDGVSLSNPYMIALQSNESGCPRTRAAIEKNFCHEMTHKILDAMGEEKLSLNEKFVGLFGSLLHQALSTGRGEINA